MNDSQARDGVAPIASTKAKASDPARTALMIGALGVGFGDIDTSPIYAFRESIEAFGSSGNSSFIFGVYSLVFLSGDPRRSGQIRLDRHARG